MLYDLLQLLPQSNGLFMNRIRCERVFHVKCPDALAKKVIADVNVVRCPEVESGF
jgi:hypothetical protein